MGRHKEDGREWVSKSEFARRMNVSPPSITDALRKKWIFQTERHGRLEIDWESESKRYLNFSRNAAKKNEGALKRGGALRRPSPASPTPDGKPNPTAPTQDDIDLSDALEDHPIGTSLTEAAAQEKVYKAKMARLEWAQLAGKLISLKDAQQAVGAMAHTTKKALRAIPDRLAARLAAETDEFQIREMLRKEIDFALDNLKYEPKPKN